MSFELLYALAVFAFVTSITPGPNNVMLMASGANFGFRRSIPHMLGIGVGFMVMVGLVGLGLMGVFDRYPVSHTILLVFSLDSFENSLERSLSWRPLRCWIFAHLEWPAMIASGREVFAGRIYMAWIGGGQESLRG